jgi:hypothetical protein
LSGPAGVVFFSGRLHAFLAVGTVGVEAGLAPAEQPGRSYFTRLPLLPGLGRVGNDTQPTVKPVASSLVHALSNVRPAPGADKRALTFLTLAA